MKKDLGEIRDDLVNEVDTAKAITEFLILIQTGAYSFEKYGITFETVQSAFCLMAKAAEDHARKLDLLTDDFADFQNDLKTK